MILDVIFPPVCSMCGKINRKSLCNKCKIKLEESFNLQEDNYSTHIDKNFQKHYYFFKYKEPIRSQILSLKFREKPYICKTMETFLKNKQKSFEKMKKYDIILVVPVSKERKKERGYNQSYLMAKEISKIISTEIEKNIIYKVKNTVPQSTLNKEQRNQNVKDVYISKNVENIRNKKILIFDDIYTTGNTANECARTLVQKGIKKQNIGVLTIAKD